MAEEASFFVKYAPYYVPILAAILLIIFTKNYLFRGMISTEMHQAQIERERDMIKGTENIANQLQEITRQLESLTKKFSSEIKETHDRTTGLEHAMSDYLDEMRDLTKTITARPCIITQNGG